MNAVLGYLSDQLKCEDCIYCDNCEDMWVDNLTDNQIYFWNLRMTTGRIC